MGKLAVYKYLSFMVLIVTVVTSGFTFFGLYGGDANPIQNTASAMLVYVLPLLILANLVLLLFWLIRRRWHWALIPFITLLCCIPYSGTIYQPGWFGSDDDENAPGIVVASYNVALFGRETSGFKAEDILSELKHQHVDIVCFQEYSDYAGDKLNSNSYKEYFPYMAMGCEDMVVYSRYPIKGTKNMNFEQTNNSAMWADVDVKGKQLRVFNVHLETTGINRTMHKAHKMQQQGMNVENNSVLKAIYGNYMLGMIARTGQANQVAMEMRDSEKPIILCGDFNDVPYSYVYNTMKGDLVDGFKECGKGFMYTFRGNKKVRIDYIFHDKSLKGISYYRKDLTYSDHYPVFMKLSL